MTRNIETLLCAAAVVCISLLVQDDPLAQSSASPPLIGIDHMPLAVKDLEVAVEDYAKLGFVLKPGRLHDNGIRNAHVKFPDGSGIELITTAGAKDALTARYIELLGQGEGPAYLGFHARDTDRLLTALAAGGIGYVQQGGLIQPADPRLNFIFFVRDNRSSSDRPAHFAHANSAVAMTTVWIATNDSSPLARLLAAVGATASKEMVLVPEPTRATVFAVENGKVALLPEAHQIIKGRPVIGAHFQVSNLDAVSRALTAAKISPVRVGKSRSQQILVPPQSAHGIWLGFSQQLAVSGRR